MLILWIMGCIVHSDMAMSCCVIPNMNYRQYYTVLPNIHPIRNIHHTRNILSIHPFWNILFILIHTIQTHFQSVLISPLHLLFLKLFPQHTLIPPRNPFIHNLLHLSYQNAVQVCATLLHIVVMHNALIYCQIQQIADFVEMCVQEISSV